MMSVHACESKLASILAKLQVVCTMVELTNMSASQSWREQDCESCVHVGRADIGLLFLEVVTVGGSYSRC